MHVAKLMKHTGSEALYRKPNTSKPAPAHKNYPYLLRGLPITRPNQVWAMRVTYIPWRGASSNWLPCSTGSRGASWHGGCRSHWRPIFALKQWRKRWQSMARQRSSTPVRAASSPRPSSSRCWLPARSRSVWMARALSRSWTLDTLNARRWDCCVSRHSPRHARELFAAWKQALLCAHISP